MHVCARYDMYGKNSAAGAAAVAAAARKEALEEEKPVKETEGGSTK